MLRCSSILALHQLELHVDVLHVDVLHVGVEVEVEVEVDRARDRVHAVTMPSIIELSSVVTFSRLLLNATREHVFNMHNLLVEVIANLYNLAIVAEVGVDWEVRILQAHPVLDLTL